MKDVKDRLVWDKEENGVIWFNCPSRDQSLDIPKVHTSYMNGELREFIIEPHGTYSFTYAEQFQSNAFLGMKEREIVFVLINEDGEMGDTYIYRLKPTMN